MLNILVVEDNSYERKHLIYILKEGLGERIKLYEAGTGEEAEKIWTSTTIDIFLLDVGLPDISGIELAESIRTIEKYEFTYIVFISGYGEFQLEAFRKIHCYDFIEKPYRKEEILEVVPKLVEGIEDQRENKRMERQKIYFQLKDFTLTVYADEILFLESIKRNCRIHTEYQVYEINNMTMKKALEILPKELFMKTHKSYILNIKKVHKIKKNGQNAWAVYFHDYDTPAYVGNKYKKRFESITGL